MKTHSSDLLYSTPKAISGSELSESHMLAFAAKKYPNKNHVVLKHWMIIDIIEIANTSGDATHPETKPIAVYSPPIEHGRVPYTHKENSGLCSDYAIDFKGSILETRDTIYILIGEGFRATMSLQLFTLLKKTCQLTTKHNSRL